MCFDSKEIECKMWMGITQFMVPLAKSQFKLNQVKARISFSPFRTFPKFRASHSYFFLFSVKWYLSQTFFSSFDKVCIPKPSNIMRIFYMRSI